MIKKPEDLNDSQRPKRDSLFLQSTIIDGNGRAIGTARVRNLSATGMLVESEAPLRAGTTVFFTLRNIGTVEATVAWSRGDRAGVSFAQDIDPQAVLKPTPQTGAGLTMPRLFKPIPTLPRSIR
jgi:PilZ domain